MTSFTRLTLALALLFLAVVLPTEVSGQKKQQQQQQSIVSAPKNTVNLTVEARQALSIINGLLEGGHATFSYFLDSKVLVPFESVMQTKIVRDYILAPENLYKLLPADMPLQSKTLVTNVVTSLNTDEVASTVLAYIQKFRTQKTAFQAIVTQPGLFVDNIVAVDAKILEAILRFDYPYFKSSALSKIPTAYHALLPNEAAIISVLPKQVQPWANLIVKGDVQGLKSKLLVNLGFINNIPYPFMGTFNEVVAYFLGYRGFDEATLARFSAMFDNPHELQRYTATTLVNGFWNSVK